LARVAGYERFTSGDLQALLRQHFERVELEPHAGTNLGLFWAWRSPPPGNAAGFARDSR